MCIFFFRNKDNTTKAHAEINQKNVSEISNLWIRLMYRKFKIISILALEPSGNKRKNS